MRNLFLIVRCLHNLLCQKGRRFLMAKYRTGCPSNQVEINSTIMLSVCWLIITAQDKGKRFSISDSRFCREKSSYVIFACVKIASFSWVRVARYPGLPTLWRVRRWERRARKTSILLLLQPLLLQCPFFLRIFVFLHERTCWLSVGYGVLNYVFNW